MTDRLEELLTASADPDNSYDFSRELYDGLVTLYGANMIAVSDLCDDWLDRRGTLLGEIRDRYNAERS